VIVGTFHNVSKRHLHLYVAEFQFRYNNRFNNDIFRNGHLRRMKLRCLIVALIFLAAFASDSWGQSSQPFPSRGKDSQAVEAKTTKDQSASTPDQRGTKAQPIIVDVVKAAPDENERQAERDERNKKTASDWWLNFFTALLALFTFSLVATAIAQIVIFVRQLRLIRESLGPAEKAASAAADAADAAKLNAQAVIAAEAAYIFVEICGQNVVDIIKYMQDAPSIAPQPILIQYRFMNHGKTPAVIKEISYGAIVAENLPRQREYSQVLHLPTHLLGAEKPTNMLEYDEFKISHPIASSIRDLKGTFWFFGKIVYDDMFDKQRTLDFVFHVSGVSEGFTLYRYEQTEEKRKT
jgi:hypothetical protein